jgi:hypothetical protein
VRSDRLAMSTQTTAAERAAEYLERIAGLMEPSSTTRALTTSQLGACASEWTINSLSRTAANQHAFLLRRTAISRLRYYT